jgi:hypothetical protein
MTRVNRGVVARDGIEPPTIHLESYSYEYKHLAEVGKTLKSSRFPELFLSFFSLLGYLLTQPDPYPRSDFDCVIAWVGFCALTPLSVLMVSCASSCTHENMRG